MPRQCLEKYLMSEMSPCLLVTRRQRISSAVKLALAASTRLSQNPGQHTWPCILQAEDQSFLTTNSFSSFTSSDKFEGDHHRYLGLFYVLTCPMTMFLFSVLTGALLPAPTPHNQQIFTLTGGTHETPAFSDHLDDDIIKYTMVQNNECGVSV